MVSSAFGLLARAFVKMGEWIDTKMWIFSNYIFLSENLFYIMIVLKRLFFNMVLYIRYMYYWFMNGHNCLAGFFHRFWIW